ncbi:MAG: hypothetical protein ABW174_05600 [Flavitalea sp.]
MPVSLVVAFFMSCIFSYGQVAGIKSGEPINPLFVHFDKTIYVPNETVWFTGYVLASSSRIKQYHTMYLSLVSSARQHVELESRFATLNGLVFGDFMIPDSLPAGDYIINCYTNLFDSSLNAADIFSQRITVKETRTLPIEASIEMLDTGAATNRAVLLKVKEVGKEIYSAKFRFGSDKPVVQNIKKGRMVITIPDSVQNKVLNVEVKTSGKSVFLTLPISQKLLQVGFFPEGGYLVNGLLSTVAWECKTSNGTPQKTMAFLCRNGNVIDTLLSGSNGVGRFKIVPDPKNIYSLRLPGSNKDSSQTFDLPKALDRGCVLTMDQAVFHDTLSFAISSVQISRLKILIHNFQDTIASHELDMASTTKKVKMLIDPGFKGLASVCVLDDSGVPVTERMILIGRDQNMSVILKTDKNIYSTREKVKLNISLDASPGERTVGNVSIACVQDNRIANADNQNIRSFFYVERYINKATSSLSPFQLQDQEYMEDLLLVKGWSKYTWQEFAQAANTPRMVSSLPDTLRGQVKKRFGKIKSPITLSIIGKNRFSTILTDNTGRFSIPRNELLSPTKETLTMIVTKQAPETYEISFDRTDLNYNRIIGNAVRYQFNESNISTSASAYKVVEFESVKMLDEVVVKSSKDKKIYGFSVDLDELVNCYDYVCMNNVLNCTEHVIGSKPVPGSQYYTADGPIIYRNCINKIAPKWRDRDAGIKIPAVYFTKEFYPLDETKISDESPQLLSTVYWDHKVNVNSKTASRIEFYTGDITGKFRIVIQGITSNGPLYAEEFITVK